MNTHQAKLRTHTSAYNYWKSQIGYANRCRDKELTKLVMSRVATHRNALLTAMIETREALAR
jgi:hypothetical protein